MGTFNIQAFLLEGYDASGGEVSSTLLRHVQNAHAGGADDQAW